MSEVKVNKISPRTACGTVTLGDSGDTFTIPAGVSISNSGTASGFGSTGEVSWVTTKKTTTFTVTAGEGYFCDTSSGGFTVNLPAGTAGASFAVADYTNTFQTGNLTISPNGSQKIGGVAADTVLSTEGQSAYFVYVDDTEGWKNVIDSTSNITGNDMLQATGGTVTECGNFKIHTFTGPGTFAVSAAAVCAADNVVDYIVVAGGAAGGGTAPFGGTNGGGGGGGGVRFFASPANPQGGPAAPRNAPAGITVSATSFPIVVGAGGAASGDSGNPGNVSTFSTISSTGGGGGGSANSPLSPTEYGRPGGSGGGQTGGGTGNFGSGNTPPVSPPQGSDGGNPADSKDGGGGGGFMEQGIPPAPPTPRKGGAGGGFQGFGPGGIPCGSYRYFAGGGGGSGEPSSDAAAGGLGGGGAGGYPAPSGPTSSGNAGTANSGGGGGGGTFVDCSTGGGGGSGIVIIRYKFQ